MSNSLKDLNAFLFAQLERLDVETLTAEDIEREAKRAEAVVAVADKATAIFDLQLRAAKLFAEHREDILPYLPQIGTQPARPE